MSGIMARLHGTPYSQHAGARRSTSTTRGYLFCTGCGASTITKADLADAAGVTPYMLDKWLNRKPVPQKVADAIRAQLARVEEGPRD